MQHSLQAVWLAGILALNKCQTSGAASTSRPSASRMPALTVSECFTRASRAYTFCSASPILAATAL